MGNIGTDVHQMGDALTTLALGIAFEKLAYLEEKHDEHRLGVLRLGSGKEADAESANGGDGHQKMLVESLAVSQPFGSLLQCVETDKKIRH